MELPLPQVPLPARAERADKTRNRARIIEAAQAAFASTGIDTQMDDVAARAGVGVGTVYRHFATKEALVIAMVRRSFSVILELAQAGIGRSGEPFEVFKDVIRAGADVTAQNAATRDALMRAYDGVSDGAADIVTELQATVQVLIDRAQAAGTMRPDVAAADVPMLMSGVSASMANVGWDWRRYLEIVLDGLAAPPGSGGGAPPEAG